MEGQQSNSPTVVAKASDFKDINLKNDEVAIVGYSDMLDKVVTVDDKEPIVYKVNNETKKLKVKSINNDKYLASIVSFNSPVNVVSDDTFNERSEEHTSELQSRFDLVCRLLLEKKN